MKKYVCVINAIVLSILVVLGAISFMAVDGYLSFREDRYQEYEYAQEQRNNEYAERLANKSAVFHEQYGE